jgi:hypothetical protein
MAARRATQSRWLRACLKCKFLDLESAIYYSLKVFRIKLGNTSRGGFERVVGATYWYGS